MTLVSLSSESPKMILASASSSRAKLLQAAGLSFEPIPANVDENSIKDSLKAENATAEQCAETLAELKAVKISQANADALVIGADQLLECNGDWFDKPADMNGVKSHLLKLRGQTHTLATSVVVAQNGARIWHFNASPQLSMRNFSDAFIERYIAQVGEKALLSVGAYQLESEGIQLFSRIQGDFFAILGLPLLELLSFLRGYDVVQT